MESKPRVRVKAGSVAFPVGGAARKTPTARYLRPDRSSGILVARQAVNRDAGHDVFEAADRANALATDFLHNSGWISGAADQIVADTIGEELKLKPRPNLKSLGYSDKETSEWSRDVAEKWRRWSWNAAECDLAGKMTFPEILDAVLRSYLATGEAFGILDYMPVRMRRRYGVATGVKLSLVPAHRLPRETIAYFGTDQGIRHDAIGRPVSYRFLVDRQGVDQYVDVDAGRVIHAMDRGENPGSPRGISPMAPVLKVMAQYDQLADATLATALLQTIFAATIKSPEPSEEAFDAIRTLSDAEAPEGYDTEEWRDRLANLQADMFEVWGSRLDSLRQHGVSMNEGGQVNHLGPGEELNLHTASTPGSQYLPFSQNLLRETARRLGITYESLVMDHSSASYSSSKMSVTTIWPITVRRRTRILTPFCDRVYQVWLAEQIASGAIDLKGGTAAFIANRDAVCFADWQGPAKPSADDLKAAQAIEKRLEMCASTLEIECAEYGNDFDDVFAGIVRETAMFEAAGIPAPFGRKKGGDGGPNGSAAEGQRDPAKEA